MGTKLVFILLLGIGVILFVVWFSRGGKEVEIVNELAQEVENSSSEAGSPSRSELPEKTQPEQPRIDFSSAHPTFRFSAVLPAAWKIEYREDVDSLNLYDPTAPETSTLDQSQIFIRKFEANIFLTLSTVTIHEQEETFVAGHPAVRYQITKKDGVADFPGQPAWRNQTHRLVDIRYRTSNPSLFYVVAYRPDLSPEIFDAVVASFEFHNDVESFVWPMDRPEQRISKKPFGVLIDPTTSPVQPERFAGYHTGTDFEVFDDEKTMEVQVRAICGGEIIHTESAQGYGGVLIQTCERDEQAITVLYGHLNLASISKQAGSYLSPCEVLGNLGKGESSETDGERKHLHLGIHRGSSIALQGYVASQDELNEWLDLQSFNL